MGQLPVTYSDLPPGATIYSDLPPGASVVQAPSAPTEPTQRDADYVYMLKGKASPGGYQLNPLNPNAKPSGNIRVFTDDGRLINVTVSPTLPKETYQGIVTREANRTKKPYDIADHPEDVANMSWPQRLLINAGLAGNMVFGAATKLAKGSAEMLGALDENPLATGLDMVRGIANSPTATKESLNTVLEGAKAGDIKQMSTGTDRFMTEAAPGLLGLEGGMRIGAGGIGAAADYIKAAPERAQIRSIDHLSEVIGPGVEGPPQFHAEAAQPFARQFLQEAGIDPRRVLPSGGAQPYLLTGGSAADLAKLNTALKAEWVRTGGAAADFVPSESVAMAIADGMVNVADRPIANAVRAVATREVPQIQNSIVAKMRATARSTPDAALRSAMENVADEVDRGGSTVGGIDNLKAHFNKESGKFSRGTPSSQSAATATSAYAYKYAADVIREELYPWLEDNTTAKGLADAGLAEASAIASRDGLYKSWTKAAKLNANAGVQKYLDYLTNGPVGIEGIVKPATTAAGMVTRIAGPSIRQMPLGRFNELLRKGIGDISNFTPADASAFATTAAPPVGYGRFRSQQGYTPTQGPANPSAGDAIQAILNRAKPTPFEQLNLANQGGNLRPPVVGNAGTAGHLASQPPPTTPTPFEQLGLTNPGKSPGYTPTQGPGGGESHLTGGTPAPNPYGIDTGSTFGGYTPTQGAGGGESHLTGGGGDVESLTASQAASSIMKSGDANLQQQLATPPAGRAAGGEASEPAVKPAKKPAAKKIEAAPKKAASGKPDLADLMSAKILNMTIEEYMKTKKR